MKSLWSSAIAIILPKTETNDLLKTLEKENVELVMQEEIET